MKTADVPPHAHGVEVIIGFLDAAFLVDAQALGPAAHRGQRRTSCFSTSWLAVETIW
jgi:hypothetical protein